MKNYKEVIKSFSSNIEQELRDQQQMLAANEKFDNILTRDNNLCHYTSSVFAINRQHTKVLCIHHNIYNSWGYVGGHSDGCDDLLFTAKKEFEEETSVKNYKVLLDSFPIALDSLIVSSHFKNNMFISSHLHFNISYLFEVDENESFAILESENSNIGWLTFDELLEKSTEPHMIKLYDKIIKKLNNGILNN